jgi:CBS domain-containing membrane protein
MPSSFKTSEIDTPLAPRNAALQWLSDLRPARTRINAQERWRIVVGSFLGILLTGGLSHLAGGFGVEHMMWLVAPMGASAVLVFAVPASPLAQPWSVVGGNTLSALVGIACARWIAPPELAAAAAVSLAIGLMLALRCLHPPGGASALLMALAGITDPAFAFYPVALNSLLLALVGIAYNNSTRRPYPHRALPVAKTPRQRGEAEAAYADLDAVLSRYNQVLDISRDDLLALLEQTQWRGYQRRLAEVRCEDIMSRKLITVSHNTPLTQAWQLLRQHRIKALPVVDGNRHVVGIVTQTDLLRAAEPEAYERADPPGSAKVSVTHSGGPDVVGRIMTRKVRVASVQRHLVDVVPLFGGYGHHHLPIIGNDGRLVGIITQSDLVAAMSRGVNAAESSASSGPEEETRSGAAP